MNSLILLENNTYKKIYRIDELIAMINGNDKNGLTLTVENKMVKYPSRFILYCLSNCPIPSIVIDGSSKNKIIIKGNKRIRTILNFINNEFSLEDGTFYKDLPGFLRFRISSGLIIESHCLLNSLDTEKLIKYIKELE